MFNKKLRQEISELKKDNQQLKDKLDDATSSFATICERNSKLKAENASLSYDSTSDKNKLREQTEADLFFTSAKICLELLKGKKKEDLKNVTADQTLFEAMWRQIGMQAQQSGFPSYGYFNRR